MAAYLVQSKIGTVPRWEQDGHVSTIAALAALGRFNAVPRHGRYAVNTLVVSDSAIGRLGGRQMVTYL